MPCVNFLSFSTVVVIVKHYEFKPYCSASNCCFGHSCHLLNLLFQIHFCVLVCFKEFSWRSAICSQVSVSHEFFITFYVRSISFFFVSDDYKIPIPEETTTINRDQQQECLTTNSSLLTVNQTPPWWEEFCCYLIDVYILNPKQKHTFVIKCSSLH